MEMIKQGKAIKLEFGDYGNYGILIPVKVTLNVTNKTTIYSVILYKYPDKDRTIELCEDEVDKIDFKSFGTTFEKELAKLGYKLNEVQFYKNKLYIIKESDGTIVPFEKYLVTFDYTNPGRYGYTETHKIECEARGSERAINYAKACVNFPSWMSNIKVTKI